ncbi:hypothetical protein ACS0TY_027492 [Phlomoides rotata]
MKLSCKNWLVLCLLVMKLLWVLCELTSRRARFLVLIFPLLSGVGSGHTLSGFRERLDGFWGKLRRLDFGWITGWPIYITYCIGIPHFAREFLGFTVSDYYFDGVWHLDEFFVMKHLEIVEDMMHYSCDADSDFLVWPHSVHGSLSTKVAYAGL